MTTKIIKNEKDAQALYDLINIALDGCSIAGKKKNKKLWNKGCQLQTRLIDEWPSLMHTAPSQESYQVADYLHRLVGQVQANELMKK